MSSPSPEQQQSGKKDRDSDADDRLCLTCSVTPPTFVPNSDGTRAAWEGFLLDREPNRCIPGLKGKQNKAPESRDNRQGKVMEGLCHHQQGPPPQASILLPGALLAA